jgi:phage gpG-like protein
VADVPVFSITYSDRQVREKFAQMIKTTGELGSLKLVVGTNVGYMAKHQLGKGVAKREFLGATQADKQEAIALFGEAIANPTADASVTALQQLGEWMVLTTNQRFETETAPDGSKWKKNTPYTTRLKQARGQILKVLQATGLGRASITYEIQR